MLPYNVSKGGILNITRCCAMDLAPFKIRVNDIMAGSIETRASYNHMKDIGLSIQQGRKLFGNATLLKRQGAPMEIVLL